MVDTPTTTPLQILGICGSLRPGSYTRMALQVALEGAAELGAATSLADLRNYQLPFCAGPDREADYPPDVFALREQLRAAHGIILGTPEYHGSYSGVLKNALDLMGFAEFEGKMLGLVGVSGGRMGALSALNSLRAIGRSLHAWVVPEEAAIPQAWRQFNDDGTPVDPQLGDRLREVGRQVTRFAYLHSANETKAFLEEWESAPPNPGAGQGRRR